MASPSGYTTASTNRSFPSARRNILGESSRELRDTRQSVPTQNFYGSGPRGSSTSRVYLNSCRSLRNDHDDDPIIDWQQGELLPTTPPVRKHAGFVPSGHSRTYQYADDNEADRAEPRQPTPGESSSEAGVQLLASEVATLQSTIDMVLERQQSIVKCNEELKLQIQKLTQSDVVTSTRKRKTSLSVQNKIRKLHNSLDKENQLKSQEPVTSAHNAKVVSRIVNELGDFSREEVEAGIAIYRRTLKRIPNEAESKRRAIRARQQRLWERRSAQVTDQEKGKWDVLKPTHMSEEEEMDTCPVVTLCFCCLVTRHSPELVSYFLFS
ncbi:hypothetical protein EMCRGX_G011764 [Ephydatia muelleri]